MVSAAWMELEKLSQDIIACQAQLDAAKAVGSFDLIAVVEREIAEKEEHRGHLLGRIANSVVAANVSGSGEQDLLENEGGVETVAALENGKTGGNQPGTQPLLEKQRTDVVWNQLTPADVERARKELDIQRTEMLARHAEELRSIEADGAEVDALEQAIDVFMHKFGGPAAAADVVQLDPARQSRA